MAMNRTGIPTLMGFSNGGDVENEQETTDASGILSTMLDPKDVTQNYALYSGLLDVLAPEPRRLTGYDLASELGKGLLAQQGEKFPSLGRGIGLGFQSFKSLQDEIDEERRKAKRERDALAFGLASKSKSPQSGKVLSIYKNNDGKVYQAILVGTQMIFKGEGETLSEKDFFEKFKGTDMRPTTEGELSKGVLDANAFYKLQDKVFDEKMSVDKLETYLKEQKDREIGFKLLADRFVGLFKTTMGENNLTEGELKQAILDGQFQSLLGGFRIETVGPGVMTEYDAQRIISALGGEPGALQNPLLVAKVLRKVLQRKVQRVNHEIQKYNDQISKGAYPNFEKQAPVVFDESLFLFEPKFPEGSTNQKTNADGSIEYEKGGQRYRIRTDGVLEELGSVGADDSILDLTS
jgi:hypothetical protein